MASLKRTVKLGAFFLLLSACATTPQKPEIGLAPASLATHERHLATLVDIHDFDVKGRIGVQAKPNHFSGGLDWQHQLAADSITLFSPLGGQVARISRTANEVTLLDQKGQTYTEKDTPSLTMHLLGWALPLDGLSDWVLGRPHKSEIISRAWDAEGRLKTLSQDGWKIEYLQYADVGQLSLPTKLNLVHENVTIKLVLQAHIIKPKPMD